MKALPAVLLHVSSLAGTALTVASVAIADPSPPDVAAKDPSPPPPLERTWLYAGDAWVAAPLQSVATSRLTYTSTESATRPFASNVATRGAMFELGGEVGLLARLSLQATGVTGESGSAGAVGTGGTAGLRFSLLPTTWQTTHLVVGAGYLRELSGDSGAWTRLSLQQDFGRARLMGTVHGEHVFARGRDGLDVMVIAAANVRLTGPLRLGLEYVGQDLEEALDDQAEGGPRHFLGPTAAVQLFGDRLSLVGGPSVGLARAPSVLGRVGCAYSF
jgi:hypothetical protein